MSESKEPGRRPRWPLSATRVRSDVREEIAFHIDERIRELVDGGMAPEAARAQAAREFGSVDAATSELEAIGQRRLRRERLGHWWSDFRHDLRFALRSAVRAPLFSLMAVLTLAVGIGANAAIIAAAKPLLFDPLPYAGQDRLVRVYARSPDSDRWNLAAGMIDELVRAQRSFSATAAFTAHPGETVVGAEGQAVLGTAIWVQPGFFELLGVPLQLGRGIATEDLPGAEDTPARMVVLSHSAWQRFTGGSQEALGRDIMVNGLPRTVVGVLPAHFVGPVGEVDFYFGLDIAPTLADPVTVRRRHWLGMLARLAPDTSTAAARSEIAALSAQLTARYPDDFTDIEAHLVPLREAMVGDARTPVLVLLASALLVLLIACSNLSGALLSRVLSRRKEFGVRAAIGAGRWRLARQLLTESLVLSVLGGFAGVALAALLLALVSDLAAGTLPWFAALRLDGGMLLTVFALTLATGLLVGALPALVVARGTPQRGLGDATRGGTESRRSRRIRGLLVSGQIALCLGLVVSAGLLGRSLWNMSRAPSGLVSSSVIAATVQLPYGSYGTPEAIAAYQDAVADRLRALPGVASVAVTTALPRAVDNQNSFVIPDAPWPAGQSDPWALWSAVSPEYFQTLGVPLLAGRTFNHSERTLDGPPVVIINRAMADRFWPDGNALGARIRIGPNREAPTHEVIGIVGDVRNDVARDDVQPITYGPIERDAGPVPSFLVRTHGDPAPLVRSVERVVAAQDAGVPLRRVEPLDSVLSDGLDARRLPVVLMMGFGALALLLATVGVYAMFASMAAAREHEFGVRMALGADRRSIATLVLRQGGAWMGLGVAIGAAAVLAVAPMIRKLLFGVSPFDPWILLGTTLVLATCALAASITPIRRATSVDPAQVMQPD